MTPPRPATDTESHGNPRLIGLRKSFGDTQVLRQIDLSLADGEMLVIVGASGCGKSTLLRLVAGLETPTEGSIVLDGKDIVALDPSAQDIAMVFQHDALYPHFTVFDNMAYGRRIRGLSKDDIERRVDEAAGMLGLSELPARKPRQLSGGQRQRARPPPRRGWKEADDWHPPGTFDGR